MSDHDTTMTMPVRQILAQLATCPTRTACGEPVSAVSGSTGYVGRHRADSTPALPVRAARRIAHEWTKERQWITRSVDATVRAVHDFDSSLTRTWRTLDHAAYGAMPATWRHRLESRARARAALAAQQAETEAWWALRAADYRPTLHRNIDTQLLPIIREKTNA